MNKIIIKELTEIDYKDWGAGDPVFFCHSRPVNLDSRENQMVYPDRRECYV